MKTLVRIALCAWLAACETSDPTSAIVDNGFPAPASTGNPDADANLPQTFVYKVWWSVTLFSDPVAAQASSDVNRVVPGSDYAYALIAPNWSPSLGTAPAQLIAVKTKRPIEAARGDTVHIAIADETIDGDCAAGSHLSNEDAARITTAIFPGEFSGHTYDPSTCAFTTTSSADAGATSDGSSLDAAAKD